MSADRAPTQSEPGPPDNRLIAENFPLATRMAAVAQLSPTTVRQVQGLHGRSVSIEPGAKVAREGRAAVRPAVVMSGWLMRTTLLKDGRRQIFGYLVPGDLVDFTRESAVPLDHTVEAITEVEIAPIGALRDHVANAPADDPMAGALIQVLAEDAALSVNALSRLLRQSAFERLAHLFLDLRHRLRQVDLEEGGAFDMPLTQQMVGDTLGLSVVHVNRVFMQLRRDGFVERHKQRLQLLEPDRLARLVEHSVPRFQGGVSAREAASAQHGVLI